ncbi:MAG: alpha/beta fold hydrolase [Opitutae bacterium]|nr:alpha/beta fold hydrolase [Opitutae bacterium]
MTELPKEISALYPFSQHDFASSGGRMNFIDEGSGARGNVVLLHGNPTWSFMWRDVVKALAGAGFRCIAPDLLGMGLSEKPHKYFTLADRISHVEELIERLGIKKFSLCAHDWGGAIGCGVAGNSPEKISKIVLMDTAAFRSRNIPKRIAVCKAFGIGPALVKYFNAFVRPAATMCVEKPLAPAVKAGFLFPYRTPRDRESVANFVRDIPLSPRHVSYAALCAVEAGLEKLRDKPMFIAWGGKDFCFGDDFYDEWCKRFPAAKTLYCENAGHYLLEDAGAEIIPEIAKFLCDKA